MKVWGCHHTWNYCWKHTILLFIRQKRVQLSMSFKQKQFQCHLVPYYDQNIPIKENYNFSLFMLPFYKKHKPLQAVLEFRIQAGWNT